MINTYDQNRPIDDGSESVYDEFAEITFQEPWVQSIWDITGHLWYHEESAAFVEPVANSFGNNKRGYREYLAMIDYPIDLYTIKEKVKAGEYKNPGQWRMDIETMFKNCKIYNEDISDIYVSAVKLENFYRSEVEEYRLTEIISGLRIR